MMNFSLPPFGWNKDHCPWSPPHQFRSTFLHKWIKFPDKVNHLNLAKSMSFITWWEKPNQTVSLIMLLSSNNRKFKGSNHFKIHSEDVLKYDSNWLLEMVFNFIGSKCKKHGKNVFCLILFWKEVSLRKVICKLLTTTFWLLRHLEDIRNQENEKTNK